MALMVLKVLLVLTVATMFPMPKLDSLTSTMVMVRSKSIQLLHGKVQVLLLLITVPMSFFIM